MSDQPFSLGPTFEAYTTTAQNGGARARIDGERIVVVLGRHEGGRPLEVSIYLRPWPDSPGELVIAAIDEEAAVGTDQPQLVVKPSQGPNLLSLAVEYKHNQPPGQAGTGSG
jgi:hypothetical protein